jgi:hypothetical protein
METRRRYLVSPDGERWKVQPQGVGQRKAVFNTKQEAVNHGEAVAQRQAPSQLVIRRGDGEIEEERTYGYEFVSKNGN